MMFIDRCMHQPMNLKNGKRDSIDILVEKLFSNFLSLNLNWNPIYTCLSNEKRYFGSIYTPSSKGLATTPNWHAKSQ